MTFHRLAAAALILPWMAGAAGAETLDSRYDLYTRGMHVFSLDYDAEIARSGYTARAKLRPKGLASLFIDMKMDMTAQGALGGDGTAPKAFSMAVKEGGKGGRYEVTWAGKAKPSARRDPGLKPDRAAAIDAALDEPVRDTLSAMMNVTLDAGEPCARSQTVYNGKEVFRLAMKRLKEDRFGDKDGGVYRGPSVVCQVTYQTIAGLSRSTMDKYRRNPPVFNAWFAPVRSGELGRDIHILVGVTGKLKGKDFVAYLNKATLSGRPLNAQSLASR